MHPVWTAPVLGWQVTSSTLMLGIAVLVATLLARRWIAEEAGGSGNVWAAIAAFWLLAFIGGRTHYVLAHWDVFKTVSWEVILLRPGTHSPGILAGALFAIFAVIPRLGVPSLAFLDGMALAGGIAFAIARIGCFMHGCCSGGLCLYPWGVNFPASSPVYTMHRELNLLEPGAATSLAVHPLQLYFAFAGLLITGILLRFRRFKSYPGQIGLAFLALFATSSAALETFRAELPPPGYSEMSPQLMWGHIAISLLAWSALAVIALRRRTAAITER